MNAKRQRVSLATLILLAAAAGPIWAQTRSAATPDAAAAVGQAEYRHEHDGKHRRHERSGHAAKADDMQAVTNAAATGEPGAGWRYFSDAAAQRAVVISPAGEYYLSRGHGLRWVASTSVGA
ncbi:MAG TPA: hypothetical protein PKO45_11230 [Rubrivivax sp.]|nr:hypothetical protein [Rubrivivax sp.]